MVYFCGLPEYFFDSATAFTHVWIWISNIKFIVFFPFELLILKYMICTKRKSYIWKLKNSYTNMDEVPKQHGKKKDKRLNRCLLLKIKLRDNMINLT